MPGFEVIGEEELAEVVSIFASGGVLFRQGFDAQRGGVFKVRDFERAFAERMEVPAALAVTSGTAALRVALAALKIGRGDSVILPAFTFVATAEAVIEAGATPVCCEVDETFNMCPEDLARRLRDDTRAVIVVHMLGMPARLDAIMSVCDSRDIPVIEDVAWGCGGAFRGRPLGAWGRIGSFSFDFAKTMTTGEGGMLTFRNAADAAAASAWHDHGHDNNPEVPRWEDTRRCSGFNFRMNELQGAVGLAQLRKLDSVVEAQRCHHDGLAAALGGVDGVVPREMPDGSEPTCDAFVFSVSSPERAQRCRDSLIARGAGTKILPEAVTWHFAGTWDHMPELLAAHDGRLDTTFPRTADLLSRSVALPTTVAHAEVDYQAVHDAIQEAIR